MKLSNNVKAFLLGVIAFLALDAVYLGSTSKMWNNLLIRISGEKIQMRIGYAAACYALIVFSWYYFIYLQYREHKNIKKSVTTAAVLGFCIYGIYELTNAAIMRKWEFKFVAMDTIWGSILYSLVTYFTLSLLN